MLKTSILDLFNLKNADSSEFQKYNEYYLSGNLKFQLKYITASIVIYQYFDEKKPKKSMRFCCIIRDDNLLITQNYYNSDELLHKENEAADITYEIVLSKKITFGEILQLPESDKIFERKTYYENGSFKKEVDYYQTGEIMSECYNENLEDDTTYYDKQHNIISQEEAFMIYNM